MARYRRSGQARVFNAVPISQVHGSRNGPSRVTIGDSQEPTGRIRLCVISVIDSDSVSQRSGECAFTVIHVPGDANADLLMKTDRRRRNLNASSIDRPSPDRTDRDE